VVEKVWGKSHILHDPPPKKLGPPGPTRGAKGKEQSTRKKQKQNEDG